VPEASSATEALSLLASTRVRADLLLTDSVMPQMSGAALMERAVKVCPGIRVLHMSGYAADQVSQEGLAQDNLEFIEKPFTREALPLLSPHS
jgi:two-component system cell cycle sensor histidine kinase/response regulator CckA